MWGWERMKMNSMLFLGLLLYLFSVLFLFCFIYFCLFLFFYFPEGQTTPYYIHKTDKTKWVSVFIFYFIFSVLVNFSHTFVTFF
uniref:Uncharacterized protein n=1 Tax=Anguilla anguilla TaxID=7936 RepID=A0A0E9WV58_ANGAN